MQQLSEALGHLPDGSRRQPAAVLHQRADRAGPVRHLPGYAEDRGQQPFDANDLLELIEQLSLGEDVPYVALPHVPETLGYLRRKDYKLGVATVDTRTATVAGLKKTGILEYFDYLGAGEDSRPKPDTCLADRFCSQCGSCRASCSSWETARTTAVRRERRGALHRHRRGRRRR